MKIKKATKQRWAKIGVEIEGAWKDVSRVLPYFKSDGSVDVPNYRSLRSHNEALVPDFDKLKPKMRKNAAKFYKDKAFSGEVASPAFDNLADMVKWINDCYPDEASYRCGIHIHVSFSNLMDYAAIMTQGFHEHLMRQINKFGDKHMYASETDKEYWTRFVGGNMYCRKTFSPLRGRGESFAFSSDRYHIMNYTAFLNRNRRTFECRAFPSFREKDKALKAIAIFLFAIEDYMKNLFVPDSEETKFSMDNLRFYLSPDEPLAKN